MNLSIGDRVIVLNGPWKDHTGVIKKKGLTSVIRLDNGQEKNVPYSSIKRYVPASEPSPGTIDEEFDASSEGVNPLELVVHELRSQMMQVQLQADKTATEAAEAKTALEEAQATIATLGEELGLARSAAAESEAQAEQLRSTLAKEEEDSSKEKLALSEIIHRLEAELRSGRENGEEGHQAVLLKAQTTIEVLRLEVDRLTAEVAENIKAVKEPPPPPTAAAQERGDKEDAADEDGNDLAAKLQEAQEELQQKTAEVEKLMDQVKSLEEQLSAKTTVAEAHENEAVALRFKIERLEEEVERLKAEMVLVQESIANSKISQQQQQQTAIPPEEAATLKEDRALLVEKMSALEAELGGTSKETSQLRKDLESKEKELEEIRQERESVVSTVERLTSEVAALRLQQEVAAAAAAAVNEEEDSTTDEAGAASSRLTSLQSQLTEALATVKSLEAEVEEERGEKKALADDVMRVQDELSELKNRSDEIRIHLESREQRMAEQVEKLRAELSLAKETHTALEEMVRAMEMEADASGSKKADKERIDKLQNEVSQSNNLLKGIRVELANKEEVLENERAEKVGLLGELEGLRKQLADTRRRVLGLSAKVSGGEGEEMMKGRRGSRQDLMRQVSNLQDEVEILTRGAGNGETGGGLLGEEGEEEVGRIKTELAGLLSNVGVEEKERQLQELIKQQKEDLANAEALEANLAKVQQDYQEVLAKLGESNQEKGKLERRVTEMEAAQLALSALGPSQSGNSHGRSHTEMHVLEEMERLREQNMQLKIHLQDLTDQLAEAIALAGAPPVGCFPFASSSKGKKKVVKA